MLDINTFLQQFITTSSGRRQKDTLAQAHAKVLANLDFARFDPSPKVRRNARQNLRRLLGKHPQVIDMIKTSGGVQ
jgi:hypothetical protein